MPFSTWSLRHPVPAILLVGLLAVAGCVGFARLVVKNMPDFELGQFQVVLTVPGESPAQLESEVARPAEDALANLRSVTALSTRINEGTVLMRVDFEAGRAPFECLVDIKEALDRIRTDLPRNMEEPRIRQLSLAAGAPTVTYAATSEVLGEEALTWHVSNTVSRALLALPGVGAFNYAGGTQREVLVELDPTRLDAQGVTAAEISRGLRATEAEASGGRGRVGAREQGMHVLALARSAADLQSLDLLAPDGHRFRLGDVASVRDGEGERVAAARLDGRLAVGFTVLHNVGADELLIDKEVSARLRELEAADPRVHYQLVSTMAEEIRNEYANSLHMLLEGALLTIVVIGLFLRSWRATLVGALALPLSILPTFAFLYWAGFTLNTITMVALIVVTGILVDDAIVEVENISRHQRAGRPLRAATELAVREIGLAVLATTLALVVVFVPMSFMHGFTGLLFRQFGWTAAAAVLSSLLVARLATPLLALWLLRDAPPAEKPGRLMRGYLLAVRISMRWRKTVLAVAVCLLGLASWLWHRLPSDFIPDSDRSVTSVNVELPPGSGVAETLATAEEVRRAIMDPPVPGVAHVLVTVGQPRAAQAGASGSTSDARLATLSVILAPAGQRPTQAEVEHILRARIRDVPGARLSVSGMGFGTRLSVTLAGENPQVLEATAQQLALELATTSGFTGVSSTASLAREDVVVRPDAARAASLGVTPEAISDAVRIATSGDYGPELAKLNLETRQVDVRVRLRQEATRSLAGIAAVRVRGAQGIVPLGAVATINVEEGPIQVNRYNRQRRVTIGADLGEIPLGKALAQVAALPTMRALPAGVHWVREGDADLLAQLFENFQSTFLLASICVWALLVLLFRSFLQPLIILCAAPLAAVGALAAIGLSGDALSLPVLLGLILLLGLVSKNSILLVDYALLRRREGLSPSAAMRDAARNRARAIVMTSMAMIAGMLPMALGLAGGDVNFSRPMAVAIIGGLVSSTALSLLVVPSLFVALVRVTSR